jgi:hypothetical protein
MANPTTLQSVPYSFVAKDAAGNAVDPAKFPTALTNVVFAVDNPAFAVTQDGLTASVKANDQAVGGDVIVTVTATAADGSTVSGSAPTETFDVAVPIVTALEVSAGTPV